MFNKCCSMLYRASLVSSVVAVSNVTFLGCPVSSRVGAEGFILGQNQRFFSLSARLVVRVSCTTRCVMER